MNPYCLIQPMTIHFVCLQIDYIHRRQHISTIETNSPKRGLLSTSTPPSQTYVPASMPLHSGHTPIGYCTLRNGTQSSNMGSSISMVSSNFRTIKFMKQDQSRKIMCLCMRMDAMLAQTTRFHGGTLKCMMAYCYALYVGVVSHVRFYTYVHEA